MNLMSVVSSISLILGLVCCWWLSSHTSGRLRKLGQAVEAVVDDQGRVQGNLDHPIEDDAIGEMTERFVKITERLKQYNEYLELLSRRLAHELRTPVSVVRSSLEHLSLAVDEPNQKFVHRANNGVARLTNILNSMSEASRLEQSLDKEEVIVFDLQSVLQGCMEGYEQAFPEQVFELILETEEAKVTGIPELIAQMLDKLIDNAEQFSTEDQPIVVRLSKEQDTAVLRISNSGPGLPETMSEKLFDPMISMRDASASEDSHLGLGLYVARLIAEFHGGSISLKNREDRQGAVVTVTVPLLRLTSKLR
jgi:signal transduction histidine kinase